MKKNWSLILVAALLLALPLWGRLSVLFARDQFYLLEDVRISSIDPKSAEKSVDIDEMVYRPGSGWSLMDREVHEGKLYILFGKNIFQDFYAYDYKVVALQIVGEEVCTISDELPFQLLFYGVDEENILYGKHYANRVFELHLYHIASGEDHLLREFGYIEQRPLVTYNDGMTCYLLDKKWEIFDTQRKTVDVDIEWEETMEIKYIAASKDHVYFYVEKDPNRYILSYDRARMVTSHFQVGEKISKLVPMNRAFILEREGVQKNYSVGFPGQRRMERIREGKKFDHFCVMDHELLCWVQDNLYEVYHIYDREIIYSTELTNQQLNDLRGNGLLFYIPPLESLRWVHLE